MGEIFVCIDHLPKKGAMEEFGVQSHTFFPP